MRGLRTMQETETSRREHPGWQKRCEERLSERHLLGRRLCALVLHCEPRVNSDIESVSGAVVGEWLAVWEVKLGFYDQGLTSGCTYVFLRGPAFANAVTEQGAESVSIGPLARCGKTTN